MEQLVLVSRPASGPAAPSRTYTYDKFLQSLQIMGVLGFGADFQFLLWEGDVDKYHYGLVNVAVRSYLCVYAGTGAIMTCIVDVSTVAV